MATGFEPTSTSILVLAAGEFDRTAYAQALRQILHRTDIGESGFAPVEIWAAIRTNPDIAVVFADRPSADARDAVLMLPRLRKSIRIVIVGSATDPLGLSNWSDCKLAGFVVKDAGIEEVRRGMTALLAGHTYFSPGTQEVLAPSRNGSMALSRREAELLPLLARGLTLREASERMAISYKTADSYRTSLLRKLGVRDRIELVRYAIRERIVDA